MARALERVLLGDVAVVAARLATLRAAGVVDVEPTPWQLCLGALRLWHRALFRPETVGTAPDGVVRPTWRARLLANRALRLPARCVSDSGSSGTGGRFEAEAARLQQRPGARLTCRAALGRLCASRAVPHRSAA